MIVDVVGGFAVILISSSWESLHSNTLLLWDSLSVHMCSCLAWNHKDVILKEGWTILELFTQCLLQVLLSQMSRSHVALLEKFCPRRLHAGLVPHLHGSDLETGRGHCSAAQPGHSGVVAAREWAAVSHHRPQLTQKRSPLHDWSSTVSQTKFAHRVPSLESFSH